MFTKRLLFPVVVLSLCAATLVASPDPSADHNIVCALVGTAQGEIRTLPLPEGPVDALCFDVDVVDPETGAVIGEGSDCLFNVQPDGAGLTLTDVTIFRLRGGEIHARANVAVQPTSLPFPGVTHVTGSIPQPGEYNILGGTGRFANAQGQVRLSGLVDMSLLADQNQISFDCLFVIDLE